MAPRVNPAVGVMAEFVYVVPLIEALLVIVRAVPAPVRERFDDVAFVENKLVDEERVVAKRLVVVAFVPKIFVEEV